MYPPLHASPGPTDAKPRGLFLSRSISDADIPVMTRIHSVMAHVTGSQLNATANILASKNAAEVANWVGGDAPVQEALVIARCVAVEKTSFSCSNGYV